MYLFKEYCMAMRHFFLIYAIINIYNNIVETNGTALIVGLFFLFFGVVGMKYYDSLKYDVFKSRYDGDIEVTTKQYKKVNVGFSAMLAIPVLVIVAFLFGTTNFTLIISIVLIILFYISFVRDHFIMVSTMSLFKSFSTYVEVVETVEEQTDELAIEYSVGSMFDEEQINLCLSIHDLDLEREIYIAKNINGVDLINDRP